MLLRFAYNAQNKNLYLSPMFWVNSKWLKYWLYINPCLLIFILRKRLVYSNLTVSCPIVLLELLTVLLEYIDFLWCLLLNVQNYVIGWSLLLIIYLLQCCYNTVGWGHKCSRKIWNVCILSSGDSSFVDLKQSLFLCTILLCLFLTALH